MNYHLPNSCWSIGIGALNSIAILDYDITASMWNNQSEEMDLNMGHHFSCELYYDSKQWLVSPIIDLGDGAFDNPPSFFQKKAKRRILLFTAAPFSTIENVS